MDVPHHPRRGRLVSPVHPVEREIFQQLPPWTLRVPDAILSQDDALPHASEGEMRPSLVNGCSFRRRGSDYPTHHRSMVTTRNSWCNRSGVHDDHRQLRLTSIKQATACW